MDQVYASLQRTRLMPNERYDIIIIGSGAGGGTMAHALADTPARDPRPRARRLRSAGSRELESGSGLEAPALPTTERWLDERGQEFRPYTHYCVGGNTKFWGSVLYRLRREDFQAVEHVDGVSPAWPIDYDTLAPYYERAERLYHVHGEAGRRSDRAAARRRFRIAPVPHAEGMAAHRRAAATPGPASVAAAARPVPGEPDGCILCNTCNSFPCKMHAKSEADVCCVRPAARAAERRRCGPTRFARRLVTDAAGTQGRGRRGRAERRDDPRRGVARRRVVRRGQLRGAAAAIGERRASERPRELVGSGRPPLHGAPGDDDAGVPPVPGERRRCSRRRSPSTTSTCADRTRAIRSARSSRRDARTASWRRRSCPRVPLVGVRRVGGARRRLAGDVRGSADARTTASSSTPTDASGCIYRPNNLGPHRDARGGDQAHPAAARLLGRDDALARQQEHHAPVRHAGVRHRPARVGARSATAARTTSRTCSSSTRRSSPRPRPSTPRLTIVAQALRVADHIQTVDLKLGLPKT